MNFRSLLHLLILAFTMILGGFFLERSKVSMNFILENSRSEPRYDSWSFSERSDFVASKRRDLPYDYYHSHIDFDFFFTMTTSQLSQFKWVVTATGLLLFAIMNALAILVYYPKNEAMIWILFLYSVIIFLSCIFYFSGFLFGSREAAYQIARKLLNAGQSGIPSVLVYFVKKFI